MEKEAVTRGDRALFIYAAAATRRARGACADARTQEQGPDRDEADDRDEAHARRSSSRARDLEQL